MSTFADAVITSMIARGITHVFGVVGGAIEPLMNSIAQAQQQGLLQFFSARHETSAVYMAEGFYRATGKMAAVVVTSGPGSTNLITGLVSTLENRIPLIVITGLPACASWGNGALQESSFATGYLLALRTAVKESVVLTHTEQFVHCEELLYYSALSEPQGPVHIALPLDIQKATFRGTVPCLKQTGRSNERMSDQDMLLIRQRINTACHIVLIIGADAEAGIEHIESLALVLHAQILVTPDAKGLVRTNAAGYAGVFGFAGQDSAFEVLAQKPDLIIALGVRIGEFSTASWHHNLLNERLVFIHNDIIMLARASRAGIRYRMSPKIFMKELTDALCGVSIRKTNTSQLTLCKPVFPDFLPSKPVHPAHLMQWLGVYMTANSFLFSDAGNAMAWSLHYLTHNVEQSVRRSWYAVTTDFVNMGFAIGVSVGAGSACMHDRIICLTGDGSMLMNGQEILTAHEHNLPVLFVVLNDASYGMVRHGQMLGGAESIGWNIPRVNFEKLAGAFDVPALQVCTNHELTHLMPMDLPTQGVCLLEVCIDRDAVPPMKQRVATLAATQSSRSGE